MTRWKFFSIGIFTSLDDLQEFHDLNRGAS
jgi:hypothetical protein